MEVEDGDQRRVRTRDAVASPDFPKSKLNSARYLLQWVAPSPDLVTHVLYVL